MSTWSAQRPVDATPAGQLTAGSLCSGYGGLDLAVMAVTGARLAWVAETDRYAAGVLAHHWPGVPNGVVPQQAAAALRLLIEAAAVPAPPAGSTRVAA